MAPAVTQQCEGVLLGREFVDGAVDSAVLASIIRHLLTSRERMMRPVDGQTRHVIRCDDGLHIVPTRARRVDDEGFESDDDTASTKSVDDAVSISSSCCLVDDHVFKFPSSSNSSSTSTKIPHTSRNVNTSSSSSSSSLTNDSANSSGSSDTDDIDASSSTKSSTEIGNVSRLVQSMSLFQRPSSGNIVDGECSYSLNDVVFCHTDPVFPKIIIWVVKNKISSTNNNNHNNNSSTGLEAIVFECQSERGVRRLYSSFQETSRRAKLEQIFRPNQKKKKKIIAEKSEDDDGEYRKKLKNVEQGRHFVGSISSNLVEEIPNRFNLVQRTDGDGVTHLEVSNNIIIVDNLKDNNNNNPSSIISINTPDVGNLLSSSMKSRKLCKEIEGVIRSDVDSASSTKREATCRQRHPAVVVVVDEHPRTELHKVWSPPPVDDASMGIQYLPERPERRKYVRNKQQSASVSNNSSNSSSNNNKNNNHNHTSTAASQKVVKGQYIRVSVDQPSTSTTSNPWMYKANPGNMFSYPVWNVPGQPEFPGKTVFLRRAIDTDDDMLARQTPIRHYRRSRSSSGSGRSRSPSINRTPMSYRYIDVAAPPSSRLLSASHKMGAAAMPAYATTARRKTPSADADGDVDGDIEVEGSLKSVIKRGRRGGHKKVTFSAYATVQVVD